MEDSRARSNQILEPGVFGIGTQTYGSDELKEVIGDVCFGYHGRGHDIGEVVIFVEEDVVVCRKANCATDVANRESDGRYCTNQVCRTDDLGYQGARDDDGANTDRRQRKDGVDRVLEVVCAGDGHGSNEGRHENTPESHQEPDPALETNNQAETDYRAANDAETDGQCSDSDLERVVSIDVVDLGRPEQKHDKEIATTEEGQEQDGDHGSLVSRKDPSWNHRELGKVDLIDKEGSNKCTSKQEGY